MYVCEKKCVHLISSYGTGLANNPDLHLWKYQCHITMVFLFPNWNWMGVLWNPILWVLSIWMHWNSLYTSAQEKISYTWFCQQRITCKGISDRWMKVLFVFVTQNANSTWWSKANLDVSNAKATLNASSIHWDGIVHFNLQKTSLCCFDSRLWDRWKLVYSLFMFSIECNSQKISHR